MPVHFASEPPSHGNGGGGDAKPDGVWNNLRLMLGQPSFSEQQMQLSQAAPTPQAQKKGVGFAVRPNRNDEVLKLGPAETSYGPPQDPPANDWKSFVAGWLADDEEAPAAVDGPAGRVTLSVNPHLAELAAPASHMDAPTPSAAKSALKKASMRGPSALPGSRAKSAMRRVAAVSAAPHHSNSARNVHIAAADDDDVGSDYGKGAKKKKKKERDKNPFRMPVLHTFAFEVLVHNIVWRVGRNFGFQAFNINAQTRNRGHKAEWTPASIFVAGDHLINLLVKNYFLRRDKGDDERQEERFAKAVFELHTTIFYSFEEHWTHMHGLSIRPKVMQNVLDRHPFCNELVVCGLLNELALWFLIYTESSSMRHMPELMWFIYWSMNHSYVMQDLWNRDPPEHYPEIREVRIGLRNKHQELIRELQVQLSIFPDRTRPEDCGRLGPIMSRLKGSTIPEDQRIIAADLVAFGDGNFYYERIVTPIFFVISYEIDHLSNLGVEVAHRLGYDDINESMAHTGIVRLALRDLRVRTDQILHGDINDAYTSMTRLGYTRGRAETNFDPQVSADWWRSNVFVKTYRERRTWLALFRAYYRVYAWHICLYHGMQAQAFVGWDWRICSSCLITHAFCHAFERFCNWYMTRHPREPLQTALSKVFDKKGNFKISRRANAQGLADARAAGFGETKAVGSASARMDPVRVVELEGSPYAGVLGFVEWILLAFFMLIWYVTQFYEGPFKKFCYDYWMLFSYAYVGAFMLHFVLTTRDGYVVSMTHALNLGPILKASSAKPDPVNWISGTMHMKWKLFFLNALFWVLAFIMKIPFDYYIICQPSVKPLTLVFEVDWLECKDDKKYFGVLPCIGGDWLLALVRLAPFLLIVMLDTSLFYQVATTIFGLARGLFKLDLGVLTAWDEVVKEFYKAPYRWWFKCMSETGNRNQLTLLKMMLFDNSADPETGAIVTDGRMFKKAVLTPEEIMGTKKKAVNVAAVLDQDDDDSAAAGHGQGPRGGAATGKGAGAKGPAGKEAAGTKGADGKPVSTGWKAALQNFGLGGDQKAAPKGGPLLPTSTNMKAMQKQLHQMQRLPAKLPMTTITERMLAKTAGFDEQARDTAAAGKPKLSSVAEKLLGNKAAAANANKLKQMTPEEKRRDIVARIQEAHKLRQQPALHHEGPSAGLPSEGMLAGGKDGAHAAVMVAASPASSDPRSRWGRAVNAIRASGDGGGASSGPQRDTLTAEKDEVAVRPPDEEEDLQPFVGAESRKSLIAGAKPARRGSGASTASGGVDTAGVKTHAALPVEEVDNDDDKPASAGSAATVATLERAGVLKPGPHMGPGGSGRVPSPSRPGGLPISLSPTPGGSSGDGSRAATPPQIGTGRLSLVPGGSMPRVGTPPMIGAGSGGSPDGRSMPPQSSITSQPRLDHMSSIGTSSIPRPQPVWAPLQQSSSMPRQQPTRMSVSGLPQPANLSINGRDAPPRYSWTGAPADAEAMGRNLSMNRQAVETARAKGSPPLRPSRLSAPPMEDSLQVEDINEDLGTYAATVFGEADVGRGDGDDDLGNYHAYHRVFSDGQVGAADAGPRGSGHMQSETLRPAAEATLSGGVQDFRDPSMTMSEATRLIDGIIEEHDAGTSTSAVQSSFRMQGNGLGGSMERSSGNVGSGGRRSGAGPVAEGVVDRVSSGIDAATVSWAQLQHTGAGPAFTAAATTMWAVPREEVEPADDESTASWWTRRVQAAAVRTAAAEDPALTTLSAFRPDGDPLSIKYEWRVEEAAGAAQDNMKAPGTPRADAASGAQLVRSPASSLAEADPARSWDPFVYSARYAGPVAEATTERVDSTDGGTEGVDSPVQRRAQAAGIDPALMQGLAKKRQPGAETEADNRVVRSVSGTSLHSHFFRDMRPDETEDSLSTPARARPTVRLPAETDVEKTGPSVSSTGTSGHHSKGRRRAVAFGGEEVEEYDIHSPAGALGSQKFGSEQGHGSVRFGRTTAVAAQADGAHRLASTTTPQQTSGSEGDGIMSRWLNGLSGWTGLNGNNKVANAGDADEEAAVHAAQQLAGDGGNVYDGGRRSILRPKSSYRPKSSLKPPAERMPDASQPVSAAQGRATSALPRSVQSRTRPITALRGGQEGMRPLTAMRAPGDRPTTARPTTAMMRPLTAMLGHDPVKEAKKKEKRDREAAIERAAGGLARSNSLIILDGADPEEDEEIDEVHAQMMMWNAFAFAWDEIIDDLRQADYINDKEVSMLKFVRLDMGSSGHGLRPILLPTFFYAGQVRKVVDTGQVSTAQIMVLNELRVLCVWLGCQVGLLSGKHAHVITSAPFHRGNVNVKHALLRKKMLTHGLKLVDQLEQICDRHEVPFDMKDIADNLYQLWVALEGECFAIHKAAERGKASPEEVELASILYEVVSDMKHVISSDPEGLKAVMKAALLNNATADYRELLRVIRVIKRMLVTTEAEATPQSEEAQRVLGFFINSLGHPSLDKPPSIDKMWSWSILTPLYEEDVLYALDTKTLSKDLGLKMKKMTDLLSETDDSISLMSYLKAMFPYEWANFKERMKALNPDVNIKDLSEHDFASGGEMYEFKLELQMWASLRGQLLARTVHGMMLNENSLRVLAKLEHPMPNNMTELEYKRYIDQLVNCKFEYVVTPQTYGKNRVSKDLRLRWLAASIDILMAKYPRLKVAFLDTAETDSGPLQFSVMARGRDLNDPHQLTSLRAMGITEDDNGVIEVYRVRLPLNKYSGRGVIIGEGKPENQNHAVIFAFGEGLQAIDMNQDNVLAETMKMRNLVTELNPSSKGTFHLFADDDDDVQITRKTIAAEMMYVMRMRQVQCVYTAIVGFREWIFSDKSGALGRFAAATEYAFGTITQRTLTHPARIRLHYGHPDLFNKMFVMTRGGMSKATRQLHLTEDVFSGCNHTLRGGRIRYKEYISCGKGRDMGFDSINGFNFKIAGGGGEWAISRESARMGMRLDFFRLLMFYHSCVGFYINSFLTSQAAFWNIYALLVFNMAKAEKMGDMLARVYNVQQILQLGTLAMIPYIGQMILEMGVVKAAVTVTMQILTGSLFFYMFQQQTVATSFMADLLYGSCKYVGTGRGFNITALDFVKVFTLYCRSHMYYAFELLFMLISMYLVRGCEVCAYGLLTWSGWLLAFVLIFAPLWFNPFSFDIAKVKTNFLAWQRWMRGDVDAMTGSNWYTWNNSSLEKFRNDGGNNTDNWMNILGTVLGCFPYLLLALCAMSRLDIVVPAAAAWRPVFRNQMFIFYLATVAIWLFVIVTIQVRTYFTELADHKPYRIYRYILTFLMFVFLIVWLAVVSRWYDGNGFTTLCVILYANLQLLFAFHKFVTVAFSQNNSMRAFVDSFHYTVDEMIGYILFMIIAFLSFMGVVSVMQMKILFNDAFAQTAGHARIARAMKDNKVGFDTRASGKRKGGPPGGLSVGVPSTAAPSTAPTTNLEIKSLVTSEHRYM